MSRDARAAENRKRQRLDTLFREYGPLLMRYLCIRLKGTSDAHDVAQEAYLRLSQVPHFDTIENPEAYVFRIATNLANSLQSKKQPAKKIMGLQDLIESGRDGDGGVFERRIEDRAAVRQLTEAMEALPPLYKAVLLLRKRDGLSHDEIAEKLNISRHTVHKYLTRALLQCRTQLLIE